MLDGGYIYAGVMWPLRVGGWCLFVHGDGRVPQARGVEETALSTLSEPHGSAKVKAEPAKGKSASPLFELCPSSLAQRAVWSLAASS